jgi:hypothetical protein
MPERKLELDRRMERDEERKGVGRGSAALAVTAFDPFEY